MCLLYPIHIFIDYCHTIIVLNDYLVRCCQGLHLGFWFLSMRLFKHSWVPLNFAPHAKAKMLCFCLMQSLSYMLWIKKCSMIFSLESKSGFHMKYRAYLSHDLWLAYIVQTFVKPIFWLSPSQSWPFSIFDEIHPAISHWRPSSVKRKGYCRWRSG